MPKLVMSDGREKEVDYNKASTIYQILQGNEAIIERATKEQLDFCSQVKNVIFDNKGKVDKPWERKARK